MTHRINDGIIIRGRVYELVEHTTGEQGLCNDCDLLEVCLKGSTEYELCQDIHDKNHNGSEVWYNYKEVKLKPIMA